MYVLVCWLASGFVSLRRRNVVRSHVDKGDCAGDSGCMPRLNRGVKRDIHLLQLLLWSCLHGGDGSMYLASCRQHSKLRTATTDERVNG